MLIFQGPTQSIIFLQTGLAFSKPYLITFLEQRKQPWNVKQQATVAVYPGM